MEEKETEEDLRLLFAPGSSLGGTRPKASVIEKDGHLAIAKFPRKDDEINTVVWEAVALSLAQKSGIAVPRSRVENIADKPVLLLRCFDRDGEPRIAPHLADVIRLQHFGDRYDISAFRGRATRYRPCGESLASGREQPRSQPCFLTMHPSVLNLEPCPLQVQSSSPPIPLQLR